jgi:hypothetical protein
MKPRPGRGGGFIPSADLFQAAVRVLGKADGLSLTRAMSNAKTRTRIRQEQYQAAQKRGPANDTPTGADAPGTVGPEGGGA